MADDTAATPHPDDGAHDGPAHDAADQAEVGADALTVDDILNVTAAAPDPIDQANAERDEFKLVAQRVQADFENFRKRTAQAQVDEVGRATGKLVAELLPVLDACEQALLHHPAETESLVNSLFGAAKKMGLEVMECEGGPFDPAEHEAVMHEPGDGSNPIVVQCLRTGYRWAGKVLRPAMVKVQG